MGFPCGGQVLAGTPETLPLAKEHAKEVEDYFAQLKDCKSSETGFVAYAVGVLSEGGKLDVWKIDENKTLTNVQMGF